VSAKYDPRGYFSATVRCDRCKGYTVAVLPRWPMITSEVAKLIPAACLTKDCGAPLDRSEPANEAEANCWWGLNFNATESA
jgi:hypothetical protein